MAHWNGAIPAFVASQSSREGVSTEGFSPRGLEAKRYVSEEWPHLNDIFEKFALVIGKNLCVSDRAKGEHYVIAASVPPVVWDEFDRLRRR